MRLCALRIFCDHRAVEVKLRFLLCRHSLLGEAASVFVQVLTENLRAASYEPKSRRSSSPALPHDVGASAILLRARQGRSTPARVDQAMLAEKRRRVYGYRKITHDLRDLGESAASIALIG